MQATCTASRWFRILALSALCTALPSAAQRAAAPDAQIQADAQKQLHGKQFRGVQAQVQNGVVTLSGTVDVLADKLDAQKRIDKMHEAASINNQIQIQAPEGVTDAQLFNKLAKKLAYVGQDYDRVAFDAVILQVRNGVAELGGVVVDPVDKDNAIGIVTTTPGIRGIVDHLQVAPVSPNDWQLRRALFRAVYGAPQLNRYAIDPGKPIRIIVVNGHATLTGVVGSSGDREVAGIRANSVPGVFSVANDLQVAGQGSER